MADLCDLIEDTAAAAGASPRNVILPATPLAAAGVLTDTAVSVLVALFMASASATEAIIDTRGGLLTAAGTLTGGIVTQQAHTASLVQDRLHGQGQLFSVLRDLAAASVTATGVAVQAPPIERVRVAGVLAARVLAGWAVVDRVTDRGRGAGRLLNLMFELASAAGVLTASATGTLRAGELASAAGVLTGAATGTAVQVELAVTAGVLAVQLTGQLIALERVHETVSGEAVVLTEANGATGWTAATDSFGMSRYRLPAFDGAAVIDGRLLLVRDGAAFVHEGTDDDGAPIDAYVRTGLDDFGSHALKRIGPLHVGYTSGGGLAVEVAETSTGAELVYSYAMPPRAASAPTHGRVKLGHGLRSLYYRFTFRNTDGQALGLDAAVVDVQNTARKV